MPEPALTTTDPLLACPNCGQRLATVPALRPRFCPGCGQETNIRPPRAMEFVQQFGGAYLSTEGALWRTLKLLLLKPGELTKQYLAGRRKHYVLPLRLYLTISVIVLLLMRAMTAVTLGDEGAIRIDVDPKKAEMVLLHLGPSRVGMNKGQFFCESLPQWVCERARKRIDVDPASFKRELSQAGQRMMANIGAALFVLLPGFALMLKGVYWNRRLHFTEHLVFALHVHAFWFLMLALMLADQNWLSGLAFFATPIYTWLALRRVYGGRWWPRLLRCGLMCACYALLMAVAMVGVFLWAVLF